MLWRLVYALFVVVVFWMLLPPVSHLLGFTLDGDLFQVIRIVVGIAALVYIVGGPPVPWSPQRA
jgi:hypothetical protein